MTSSLVTPSSPVAQLEPWIAARLNRSADPDVPALSVQSDYDLQPDLRPAKRADLGAAAVLVPLVERPFGLTILLTRRSDTLTRHSGQVAFPGGRLELGETAQEAALRETEEEIGLDRRFVRVVGFGDPYETVTGFRITPVVGFVREGFALSLSKAEVAEVFETPFAYLMDGANHERRRQVDAEGLERQFYAISHDGPLIWGATAAMLRGLYERMFSARAEALSS